VVNKHCAQMLFSSGAPQRCEGFAVVVRLQNKSCVDLEARIQQESDQLERRSNAGALRERAYALHGYSRLLDQERLLYLMSLLLKHPQLPVTGEREDPELQQLLWPLPGKDLASQAAALLARIHGVCYGDALAVAADLHWLQQQGFWLAQGGDGASGEPLAAIVPPPWPAGAARPSGGLPSLADQPRFVRALTLLRHLLHHPLTCRSGVRIDEHLAEALNQGSAVDQPWRPREVRELIATTITPYGFQLPGSRGRSGYGLGLALLARAELIRLQQQLQRLAQQQGDGSALEQAAALAQRLQEAGVMPPPPPAPELPPVIADGAVERTALRRRLEQAISERQRLELACSSSDGCGSGPLRELRCWPLQLLLHRDQWWLLVEHDPIGHPEGLLAALPLTALHWRGRRDGVVRSEQRHGQALQRSALLRSLCGGMALGRELAAQQLLCRAMASERGGLLQTLRLSATAAAMAVLVEELLQLQPQCVRAAAPLPGDHWLALPQSCNRLAASSGSSHPYPLEIDLPPWVIAGDPVFHRWLFSLGSTIRIEAPAALRKEHRRWLAAALALHQSDEVEETEIAAALGAAGADLSAADTAGATDAAEGMSDPGRNCRRISKTMSSSRTGRKASGAP